jgi:hypothetical protein
MQETDGDAEYRGIMGKDKNLERGTYRGKNKEKRRE